MQRPSCYEEQIQQKMTMKIKKIFYVLPALMMAGCSKSPNAHFDSGQLEAAPQKNVSSIVIKENIDCTYPVKIARYDSLFVIQDIMNQGYVYVLDSKGEEMGCLVKKETDIRKSAMRRPVFPWTRKKVLSRCIPHPSMLNTT